jgi:hypothetical protein
MQRVICVSHVSLEATFLRESALLIESALLRDHTLARGYLTD